MVGGLNNLVTSTNFVDRIGSHCHIKGLGVSSSGINIDEIPIDSEADGFIGQKKARQAAFVVVSMIKKSNLAGRVVLLTGKPGSGKTALALGIARSLGTEVPFMHLAASEVYSVGMSKIEVLTQAIRRSVGVSVKEQAEVIEGEIVDLVVETTKNGTRKGSMTICTKDMESLYRLGPKLIALFEKKNIVAGDIISLDKDTGRVTKLGRSFSRSPEFDAHSSEQAFIARPSGELQKVKKFVHTVTLHDIDIINSRVEGFTALFAGDTGEVPVEVRNKVDGKVAEWILENKATWLNGVLFIDECHLLDIECFSFLNQIAERSDSPLIILATNRDISNVRGTKIKSPHGIPLDFLDRALIIPTETYDRDECRKILFLRAKVEGFVFSIAAMELLVSAAQKCSLRYALNLIGVCGTLAKKQISDEVQESHVEKCFSLFLDVGRSVEYIKANEDAFTFG